MKIENHNSSAKVTTRTHHVAGQDWTFTRKAPGAPLVCDVTDDTAVQVFLAPHNRNAFSPAEPVAELKRPEPGSKAEQIAKTKEAAKAEAEAEAAAKAKAGAGKG